MLNTGRAQKSRDYRQMSCCISETLQERSVVVIEKKKQKVNINSYFQMNNGVLSMSHF